MDISKNYFDFVKEACALKNYKRMHPVWAVLCGIIVLPFILSFVSCMLVYGANILLQKFLDAPCTYLLSFVKKEGDEVKSPAQAVIYFFAFPVIFGFKLLTSLLIFSLFITHLFASIDGYFASLGGVKFSPILTTETERTTASDAPKYATAPVVVFVAGCLVFVLLTGLFGGLAGGFAAAANSSSTYTVEESEVIGLFDNDMLYAYNNGIITKNEYTQYSNRVSLGIINTDNYADYYKDYLDRSPRFVVEGTSSFNILSVLSPISLAIGILATVCQTIWVPVWILVYFGRRPKVSIEEIPEGFVLCTDSPEGEAQATVSVSQDYSSVL